MPYPRTCAVEVYNHRICANIECAVKCMLNMYGSDAAVRGDWGVVNTPAKSRSLFALHTLDLGTPIAVDDDSLTMH